jgi:hypothetical protein
MDVPITVDTTRANAQVGVFATTLRAKLDAATKALGDIQLSADSTDVERKIAVVRAQLETLKNQRIGVDIDAGDAQAKIAALEAELAALGARSPNIQVKVDVDAARANLRALIGEAESLASKFNSLDLGSTKIAAIGAAAIPAIQSIGQLSGALGLIPAVATGVATALGAVVVGSQGLGEAFKAQAAAEEAATAAAKTDAPARQAVAAANQAATAAGQQNIAALQQQVTQGAANVASLQAQKLAGANVTTELKAAQAAQAANVAALKNAQAATSGNVAALGTYKTAQQQAKQAVAESEAAHKKAKEAADAYAASLSNLAPSAREFVSAVVQLKPAFEALRLDVQQQLFKGVGDSLLQVGNTALPVLRQGLSDMAGSLNRVVQQILQFVQQQSSIQAWQSIFSNLSTAADNLAGAVKPILQIITDVTQVGSELLPGLATSFAEAAQKAADFVSKAKESGQLKEWIQAGIDAVKELWGIFKDVVAIIADLTASPGFGPNFLEALHAVTTDIRWLIENVPGLTTAVQLFFEAWVIAKVVTGLTGMITKIKEAGVALGILKVAASEAAVAETAAGTAASGLLGPLGLLAAAALVAFSPEGQKVILGWKDALDTFLGTVRNADGAVVGFGGHMKGINAGAPEVISDWSKLGEAIKKLKDDIATNMGPIPAIGTAAIGGLVPIINTGVANIATAIGKVSPLVQASLVQLAPALRAPTEAALAGLLPIIASGMQNITNQVNGLTPQIQAALAPLSPAMQQSANAALGGMLTVVNTGIANIITAVQSIPQPPPLKFDGDPSGAVAAAQQAQQAGQGVVPNWLVQFAGDASNLVATASQADSATKAVETTHQTTFTGDGAGLLAAAAGGQSAIQGVVPDWLTHFAGDAASLVQAAQQGTQSVQVVPQAWSTTLTGDASGVTAATSQASGALGAIVDKNVTISATDNASVTATTVNTSLAGMVDKTVTINANDQASGAVKSITGFINGVPDHTSTINVNDNATNAINNIRNQINSLQDKTVTITTVQRTVQGAEGFILAPMAAGGNLTRMSSGSAQVVPPNTWRVIGDRMSGDEAFIPINNSPRSESILGETANRMGFALMRMASGGYNRHSRSDQRAWEELARLLKLWRGHGHGGGSGSGGVSSGMSSSTGPALKGLAFGPAGYTYGTGAGLASLTTTFGRGRVAGLLSDLPSSPAVPPRQTMPTAHHRYNGSRDTPAINFHVATGNSGLDQWIMELLRRSVRIQGGGNVQSALGS